MIKQKDFIPALGYDFLTAYYDLTIKLTMPEKRFRTLLVEELNPQSGEKILEFGFGTGQNLLLVKQKEPKTDLIGLDIDPKVRDIAQHKIRKNGFELPLDLYDGSAFPYADAQFDKVYSSLVFHQLDAATKLHCLKEIYRVLKPNGHLLIGDWGKAKSRLMRGAFYAVQLLDGFKTTNDNVNGLMPNFISQAGFVNVIESQFINTMIGTYAYYTAKTKIAK